MSTGEKKRSENSRLLQLRHEQELEDEHRRDWYHPTSTAKDEQYALENSWT